MLHKHPIDEAVLFLQENLGEIYTVKEWATFMGYSRTHFSYLIKEEFDQSPYIIIKHEKHIKVKHLVRENPDQKGRVIANTAGFSNVKSLYKFLAYHYKTSLTELRKDAKNSL